jgi:hypothetical protein
MIKCLLLRRPAPCSCLGELVHLFSPKEDRHVCVPSRPVYRRGRLALLAAAQGVFTRCSCILMALPVRMSTFERYCRPVLAAQR